MYNALGPSKGEHKMKEIDIANVTIKFERGPRVNKNQMIYLQQSPPTMMQIHLNKCMQQNHHTLEGPKQS